MYKENTKRFMIILNTWSEYSFKEEVFEFDTDKEVKEEEDFIDQVFKDYKERDSRGKLKEWGYVVLDFKNKKVLRWGGPENRVYRYRKGCNPLELLDIFFRANDEVPEGYVWDRGEYEGWLRFRWGDGKNAVDYKKNSKSKKVSREEDDLLPEVSDYEVLEEEIMKRINKEGEH